MGNQEIQTHRSSLFRLGHGARLNASRSYGYSTTLTYPLLIGKGVKPQQYSVTCREGIKLQDYQIKEYALIM